MTTADLRAAAFHLRPSNILVTPLDAAGVYTRGDLVVYRASARAELLRGNTPFALGAEQNDLLTHLDLAVDPEDAGVHRNPSEQRAPEAPDQGLSPPREGPPVPLRVPDGHGRRIHWCLCLERKPVGHPVPPGQPPYAGDVALEGHRRTQVLSGRVSLVTGRMQPVERNARTDAIVVRPWMPEGGSRVRGVDHDPAEGLRGEDGVEARDLTFRRLLVRVGRGEVRVDAGEPRAEYLARLPHLGKLDAPAVHPRVHLEVNVQVWMGCDAPRDLDRVGRHLQTVFCGKWEPVRQEVGKDQDRGFDTGAAQFSPLLDGDDGEGVCPRFDTGAGDLDGAVAVGIRLDDGHQARVVGPSFEGLHVVSHGAKVDLGPGTAGYPNAG